MVRDFSPNNSFTWNTMQEGNYDIRVTVKDSFGASTGESASASYAAKSRVVGTGAVISPTSNPLVALYSAPPSAGSSMYVEFSQLGPNPSWISTAPLPIVPGESTNFLVAGMLPNTTYLMRHVLNDGAASAPLAFRTGALPTNVTFPTLTVPQAPAPGTDLTQDMIFHVASGTPTGTVSIVATDLNANVVWYYDPVANNFPGYAPNLEPGGIVLILGGQPVGVAGGWNSVREVDLAGDPLRETNVDAVNTELAALGQHSILDFDHEVKLLPNGDTVVLASTQRTIDVNGTPTTYIGNMVLVLDQDYQVAWVWDSFNWLDTNRLPTLGEGPGDWLHGNAVSWSPADGNLIVSLRSQDWVIKIDYANGTGDGHVVWKLGQGGDFTINSSDPSPWFSHQHDARYVNDTTLVLFDDGNVRRASNSNADSRGQELVLNERTMQATLVVNADLGNYSAALGSAQMLPNGNLAFTSGLIGSATGTFGQSIEVLPDGTKAYVQQMSGLHEYRSYFMSTLYGPFANLLKRDNSTQGNWIGAYGSQGYDLAASTSSLPSYATVTAGGQSTYVWSYTTTDPRALKVPGSAKRIAATWYSATSFTVDVNLTDGQAHDLELYFLDWEPRGRAEQVQVSDAVSGKVLDTEAVANFSNGLYLDWKVSGHVLITITRQSGPNAVLSGLFFG